MKLFSLLKRIVSPSRRRSKEKLVDEFCRNFGYLFQNRDLLIEALTHRSFVYCNSDSAGSNERLEYLGDSVLGLVIANYLYDKYPDYDEGDLTKTKAILVNEVTLSKVGRECGLSEFILMSPEEEKSGGRQRHSIISDAVEAVIGAIYLDSGLKGAADFISRVIISHSQDIFSDSNQRNYKGDLLEYLQSKGEDPPYYEVISEEGPDHDKTFNVIVRTRGRTAGSGKGPTKKEAEQIAASAALKSLLEQDKKEANS